jgi:putative transcriptional regulator
MDCPPRTSDWVGNRMGTWDQSSSLAPSLLVAMPQLQDPNFSKSVVLLCEHREEGAMGLVINRCTDTLAATIVQLDPPLENESESGLPVWIGGPVDPARGWLLLAENLGDGIEVSPGLYLSASRDLLRRVLETRSLADRCRFLVGYAGWGPRQLDSELAASAWLTVPVDKTLLFETPVEEMWEVAIRRLGIDPHALALGPGVH